MKSNKIRKAVVATATLLTAGAVATSCNIKLDTKYQETSKVSASIIEVLKTRPYKTNLQEPGFIKYIDDARNRDENYMADQLAEAKKKVEEEYGHHEIVEAFTEYPYQEGEGRTPPDFLTFNVKLNDNYERVIFYLHGGAYFKTLTYQHIAACYYLAQKFNAIVYAPQYPIAPQHDFNDCFYFIDYVYNEISTLEENKNKDIILVGDSAGAGLALGYSQYLYKHKKDTARLPVARVLYSPWCDVTMTNPDISTKEEADVFLAPYGLREIGKIWAGFYDRTDYRISPKYGDLDDNIPTIIFQGEDEILLPDTILTAKKLHENKCRVRLVVGKRLFHVYPIFLVGLVLPEAEEALNLAYDFVINKK